MVYAIRAAVFDAYEKGNSTANSILYTTLYPSNVCAQCIREARVDEVVYVSDKFHKTKFMEASRRIMEGIKCRYVNLNLLARFGKAHPLPYPLSQCMVHQPLLPLPPHSLRT